MIRYLSMTLALMLLCLGNLVVAAESSGLWLDVPFVKQEKNGCGAASIAMVMQYWMLQQGRTLVPNADAIQIQRALYSGHAQGVYASDLERYLQQQGFRTFAFRGEWTDLEQQLEKGRPLIVALKPASGNIPLHYVVIAGLDWEQGLVMVNDPAQRKLLKQDRTNFEREWSAAGKWTLLAVPQPDNH
jgi:ABC-type bacteriocin/lantibiotic exporter with double-glycine peptidase domain